MEKSEAMTDPQARPLSAEPRTEHSEYEALPIGYWFVYISPDCTHRYSIQERTSGGCAIVCSTPYVHEAAKRDMEEIAESHNARLRARARTEDTGPDETAEEVAEYLWRRCNDLSECEWRLLASAKISAFAILAATATDSLRTPPLDEEHYLTDDLILPGLELPNPCRIRISLTAERVSLQIGQRDFGWKRGHPDSTDSGTGMTPEFLED